MAGIYKIENTDTQTVYIGQSVDLPARQSQHLCKLRKGTHGNKHLQASFNKHGEEAFKFSVVEYCREEDMTTLEQHYLDLFKTMGRVFNKGEVADSPNLTDRPCPVCKLKQCVRRGKEVYKTCGSKECVYEMRYGRQNYVSTVMSAKGKLGAQSRWN